MKRYILIILLCIVTPHMYADPQEVFGRSFMYTRPAYDHIAMNQQLWYHMHYATDAKICGSLQATVFGQDSMSLNRCDNKFSRYFLINKKNTLLVSGDNNANDIFKRDIRAEWLGLPADFRGECSLNPSHTQVGFVFEYNQSLDVFFESSFFENSYVSITVPFAHVENNLNLKQENIQNPGTTGPRDIVEAFRQTSWLYDRIDGKQETSGFTEVKILFGRLFLDHNNHHLSYYTGLVIPTTSKPDPEYLFNSYVGNRRHVGLNGGVSLQLSLSDADESNSFWALFLNLDATFLIRNKQFRTFDLKEKPWSRFLKFNTEHETAWSDIPGVNVLTLETVVRPYGVFDFSTGIRYNADCFECELGYNIWGHDDETVELREPFVSDKGIAAPLIDGQKPKTASGSTIALQSEPADTTFVKIRESDIDLRSAAAASALNHTLHLAAGMHNEHSKLSTFMGIGTYIEWAQKNRPLYSWGAWAKIGFSF